VTCERKEEDKLPLVKCYVSIRTREGCVVRVDHHGRRYPLPLGLEVWNHSPDGFEWGYAGSGPAQLALALLLDATGNVATARECHQQFKREIVGKLDRDCWMLTETDILGWLALEQQLRTQDFEGGQA
jgi:hypothetical protein